MKTIKFLDSDFWAIKSSWFQRDDQHQRSSTMHPPNLPRATQLTFVPGHCTVEKQDGSALSELMSYYFIL